MIGLITKPEECGVAGEFFELFKTPWEFYRQEARYDVVLCVSDELAFPPSPEAKVIIVYAGKQQEFDQGGKVAVGGHRRGGTLFYKGERFPVYGDILTFHDDRTDLLEEEQSRQPAAVRRRVGDKNVVRIGYDLFHELRVLLSNGQPHEYAAIPTVEIHIRFFRDLIIESGVCLIEIPPIPEGHTFIACLTHDVDHPSIRRHKWDRTAFGFLYRAVIGSMVDLLRGRIPVRHFLINWSAAARLPLMYLGFARDCWLDFDRYLGMEKNTGSTFFVVPFKGTPGRTQKGSAPRIRAAGYGASDIDDRICKIMRNGGEIGVHGIDAWVDVASGQTEKVQIEKVTGTEVAGVRMHWLYFNWESPALLEKAGFAYDSTVGYNETVGYRAGTMQVYKPINVSYLLELPMHVMDTALFYPTHLNLSSAAADQRIGALIENANQFGGVLTFNWHDRSIAPERLWGDFYSRLLDKLKVQGAWCTNASRAVTWFQKRRAVVFKKTDSGTEVVMCHTRIGTAVGIPAWKVRVYNPQGPTDASSTPYIDTTLTIDQKCIVPTVTTYICS